MDNTDFFFDLELSGYQGQPTPGSVPDQASNYFIPASSSSSGMPTIPENRHGHFQSASYTHPPVMESPLSYESQSSGHISSPTISTPMSSFEQSPFPFWNSQPARSIPVRSLLTTKLKAQRQMTPNDFVMAQSGSPMVTSPMLANSSNLLASPEHFVPFSPEYPQFQSPLNGYNLDKDQRLSRQFDAQLLAMQPDAPSPISDWFPSPAESVPPHPMGIAINRPGRHASVSGTYPRSPYSRGEPMTFSSKSDSSSLLMCGSLPGGSYTSTPTMGAGFSQEQLPTAHAILQFIVEHPREPIPSHLINDRLVEIKSGRGYCLIGNCGAERAMQKFNPDYDPSKDTTSRKRADHLYDHIRDKHFNCRPFQCGQCSRAFSRDHDLKRHETVHSPTAFLCRICPRTYTREDNLKRHISQKHPEVALH
jgi:hypothetical protein